MSVERDLLDAALRYVQKYPECTVAIDPPGGAGGVSEEEEEAAEDEFVEFV